MADYTLSRVDRFPQGTSVGAYPVSNWPTGIVDQSAAPVGAATNSQTMGASNLTFTGLTAGVRYVAYAQVGGQHRYVGFTAAADLSEVDGVTLDPDGTLAANSDERVATQKAVKTYGTAIPDSRLASPGNAQYRALVGRFWTQITDAAVAGTLVFSANTAVPAATTGTGQGVYHLDPADYAVAGLTTRYRVKAMCFTNSVAPAITMTIGLYPVTASGGAADVQDITLGTVVTGSTVAFASPSANTRNQGNSGDFTAPAADYYALAVVLSGGPTADSRTSLNVMLERRNT